MRTESELIPLNMTQKSFYKKAWLINEGNITKLKSYNTIVAEYNHKENKIKVFGWYSMTTAKHINAFLSYFGFKTMTKKEMLENGDN